MTPRISKLLLTTHITFSVGWFGSVAVFLALAITALNTNDIQLSRSCCLAMNLSTWFIIVPFCFTSLLTGIVQAICTKWRLFKHYWIVVKLFLTLGSTILLLLHMQPISNLAVAARDASFSNSQQSAQLINLITKSAAAILVLLAVTTISIYKPWGKIQLSKQNNNQSNNMQGDNKKTWRFYALIGFGLVLIFIILHHLFAGGMQGH